MGLDADVAIKVLHVTTGLESGGAETMLFKLASRMDRNQFECSVLSLTDSGPILGDKIRAEGLKVDCLGFRRGLPHPAMIMRLAQWIRRAQPDVVQTWMYHADLVGALAWRLTLRAPLVWGIHSASLDPSRLKRQTRAVISFCARLSRMPAGIVCCSEAARAAHTQLGYAPSRMAVINNGVDAEEFSPNPAARREIREEIGLPREAPLVGLVARFDPQKDHRTFLRAAGLLRRERPDAHFILCGADATPDNETLSRWINEAGLADSVHRLGLRADVAHVTAALDSATCCSVSESFGLVLGEAMACGVPCVTTDLPGPVALVGDFGRVVPVGDAAALANAWQADLCLDPGVRLERGARARRRIQDQFSLQSMVQGYEHLYRRLSQERNESRTAESAALYHSSGARRSD